MQDKKKYDFGVYNYEYSNVPMFREDTGTKWVTMGEDNMYPNFLEDLLTGSSMHNAIVKGSAEMIYGHGLDAHNKDEHIKQWLKLKELFGDGEALKRAAFDLKLYGQCYLNPIWSQDRTKIAEVKHIPAAFIRVGKPNDQDEIPLYYHSTEWENLGTGGFSTTTAEPLAIPRFNPADRTAASTCLHIKLYNPISYFYGIPDWVGGVRWVNLDRQVAEFHSSNMASGLFPSMILNFNSGVPTDEERRKIEQLIYEKFSGARNAGKFLMTFNDNSSEAPTVEAFQPTDPQKTYQFFSEETAMRILQAHRVNSGLLFGLKGSGSGFGNNADEMRDAYDLFHHTVIKPFQEVLLKGIHPLLSVNDITLDIFFEKLQPATFLKIENVGASMWDADVEQGMNEKDASYNGAQISSAVDVLVKVQEGLITQEQAIVFLVQMLQFSPEVAQNLFMEGVSAVEEIQKERAIENDESGSTDIEMSRSVKKKDPKSLRDRMRLVDSRVSGSHYLVREEMVEEGDMAAQLHSPKKRKFYEEYARNYDEISSEFDIISPKGYYYAVRYQYAETANSSPLSDETRDFCWDMMGLSDDGVMYRYEDIIDMEGENEEFFHNGQPYSIWEHSGGIYCYHGWKRLIFIYSPDGEPAIQDIVEYEGDWEDVMVRVGDNPYIVNKGEEFVAPIDTPNRGAYPK